MMRSWVFLFGIIGIVVLSWPADGAGMKVRDRVSLHPRVKGLRAPDSDATRKASNIVHQATEHITADDLIKPGESFSPEAILDGLKERASNVALEHVKKDPKWSFEVLTGKLSTNASVAVVGGELKLGEANVYKIIGLLARTT
jgi:hypothetical protein